MSAVDADPSIEPFARYFRRGDGGRLKAEQWGEEDAGPALVFLHGGGQNRHAWRATAERFAAQGYTTLIVDQRGHGESERARTSTYVVDEMADDVVRICRTLRTPPVLVGASMGGILSLIAEGELAPGSCRALVLVDVVPEVTRSGIQRVHDFFRASAGGFADRRQAHRVLTTYAVHREPTPASTRRNLEMGPDGRWYWHWDPDFARTVDVFHDGQRMQRALQRVAVPVLVLRGEHSDIVPASAVADLHSLNQRIRVAEVPGATHMITAESNDTFADVIESFLRESILDHRGEDTP